MKRSKLITKIIVFALVIYAGASLISLRGRIENARRDLSDIRRQVADMEITNAELEYEIDHYNDPAVIADIARSRLGLILPGEIVLYEDASAHSSAN
ncbi:MAG: septum formation initiator family protein [Oscillospiraceae bacterium]|nr:septum formation initiator family protein [Oscillospiraceae bacterium]